MSRSSANTYKQIIEPARVAYKGRGRADRTSADQFSNEPSALFQLDSDDSGFLPPRMTTTQRNAIIAPAAGLLVYNKSTGTYDVYNGTTWIALGEGGAAAPTLSGTLVWDPAATSGSVVSPAITVTGAALGEFVQVAAPYDLQGLLATAYVSAENTVKIVLTNLTGSTVTLSSGTWKVRVG